MTRWQKRWQAFCDLPWIVRVGAWLALLILFALALPARAGERVARQGGDEVRLSDTAPCTNEAARARIHPQMHEHFRAASGRFGGQVFAGCWRDLGGAAGIVWEDGDSGIVPDGELKDVPEA